MIQQSIFHSPLRMILVVCAMPHFAKRAFICREILITLNALHMVHADRSHVSPKEGCVKCRGEEDCMTRPQHFSSISLSLLIFCLLKISLFTMCPLKIPGRLFLSVDVARGR